jgi:hypothetical protein
MGSGTISHFDLNKPTVSRASRVVPGQATQAPRPAAFQVGPELEGAEGREYDSDATTPTSPASGFRLSRSESRE